MQKRESTTENKRAGLQNAGAELNRSELFTIGEVSKMFHLSPGILRHYEQKGLISPEFSDTKTGYRYYSIRQFEALNTIRYLRVLDVPLPKIKQFLGNRDLDVIEGTLREQMESVNQKINQLCKVERKIQKRLEQLDDARNSKLDTIELRNVPETRLIKLEDKLKISSFYDMESPIRRLEGSQDEALVFLGKVGIGISETNLKSEKFDAYDCIFLILDDVDSFNGKCDTLPPCTCVSVRFCGSHAVAKAPYRKLTEYIKSNDLEICGFSREITMIDYGFTNDTDKFVTEILIPVKAKTNF